MVVARSLRIIGAWGTSHRTLLMVCLAALIIGVALIGWRQAYLYHQSSTAQDHVIDQTTSSIESGLLNTVSSSKTDVQVQAALGGETDPRPVVKINSQPVSLPVSGEIHRVVQDSGGTTVIDVSVKSSTSGNSSSDSSTSVQLNSTSESTAESSQQVP